MKILYSLILTVAFGANVNAQSGDASDPEWRTTITKPDKFYIVPALKNTPAVPGVVPHNFEGNPISKGKKRKIRTPRYVNPYAAPQDGVTEHQSVKGTEPNRAPIANFDGGSGSANPQDPSGAVGPNHYMQAMHMDMQIWDKNGTSLWGPSSIGTFFTGNPQNGDPIVMYDEMADRWFMSQFGTQSDNKMYIAISKTPDPLGEWYAYEYSFTSFPDYMKFSIWHDGYYMTSNMQSQNFTVFNRTKMLAGDASAEMVAKTQSVPASGFYCALAADAEGSTPPTGPQYFFALLEDGWGGGISDGIRVYSMATTWGGSPDATVTQVTDLAATAFNAQFTGATWQNIPQQGTSQGIDELSGFLLYRAAFRQYSGYNAVALCHAVNVGSNRAGIKWYEIRETGGTWSIYQQGVYAPDDGLSRWCPSIALDAQGNIGLAFSVSSSGMYPALKYTGRRATDPVGTMTVAEELAVQGTSAFTTSERYGDYGHLSCDPDGSTFWMTAEYASGGRKTRIYSFKLAQDLACDVGASGITAPTNGVLTATQAITVSITNFGTDAQSNVPVSYAVNGGAAVNETYTGSIAAGATVTYTFTQTADMSNTGTYSIVTSTALGCDLDNSNNSNTTSVEHQSPNNIGATAVTAPVSGTGLGATETVSVTIENFGTAPATGFPVSYTINGGAAVTENHAATINAGASATYNFATTADLSALGDFAIVAYTDLSTDGNRTNDTTNVTVAHTNCTPAADCSYGDGFTNFTFNTINNTTTCDANGYGDYTSMSTDVLQGSTHTFSFTSGYTEQWVNVWIDYNDNFSFEANEIVVADLQLDNGLTADYTIPANAPLGEHLMRGRTNWQATSNDPCAAYQYGETEDYKVNITDPTVDVLENEGIEMTIATLTNGQFDVNLSGVNETLTLEVFNTVGQLVDSRIINSSDVNEVIDLRNHAKGAFLIKVGNDNFQKVEKVTFW